jgi:hypothetical protein
MPPTQTSQTSPKARRVWSRRSLAGLVGLAALIAAPAGVARLAAFRQSPSRVSISVGGHRADIATVAASGSSGSTSGSLVCPPSTYPVNGQGNYGVAFTAALGDMTVVAGYNEDTHKIQGRVAQGWSMTVKGITGQACGLLEMPQFEAVIQPSGLQIDASNAQITLLAAGTVFPIHGIALTITPAGPLTAKVSGVGPGGALEATGQGEVNIEITGTSPVPPDPIDLVCNLEMPASVTTGTDTVVPPGRSTPTNVSDPWTVSGQPVTGPLQSASAQIVANDFPVPPLQYSSSESGCNLAGVFMEVLGGYNQKDKYYVPPYPVSTVPNPPGETQLSAGFSMTGLDLPVGVPSQYPSAPATPATKAAQP